jgi:hypothetical protein
MVSRTASRVLVALGLFAAAGVVGCEEMTNTRLDFNDTEQVAVKEIIIAPGSGNVTVRTSDIAQVEINRVVRYRGAEPDRTYEITGSVLEIDVDCGQNCSVDYEITAPKDVAVRGENHSGDLVLAGVSAVDVRAGSGNIEVTGASGAVKAETGSGDIRIDDVAGDLEVKTGSGNIEALAVGGKQTTARTGSGDVTISLNKVGGVRTHTGSGNVEVTVPAGSYRVNARTGSGDTDIGVPNSPGSAHLLDLDTGSGDITLLEG